jgi:flagellar basal-body rod modification protein FlgD
MLQPASSPTSSGALQSAGSSLSQASSQQVGKDGFLKMLVTQLKNQNPTDPMKGRDFASQLAQFSSVEQLTSISDQLKSQKGANQALTESVNSGVATDLIGRTVEAKGNQFTQSGGQEKTLGMTLSGPASKVTVTIRDAGGNAVRTRTLENVDAGPNEITWDGTTDAGAQAPDGNYSFNIEATGPQGSSVDGTPYMKGTVDRISFGKKGPRLIVDGTEIPMGRVRSVSTP